jgi:NAD(P)-dependent dehydrogenase (short-subunit alcohol dehydrogenase family)
MPADHAVQHREKQWRMLILGRNKTVIVTGASQGIGAAIAAELLKRGYDVVATSRSVSRAGFASPPQLALVDGGIILEAASENITRTAVEKFGSINHVVNNAEFLEASRSWNIASTTFAVLFRQIWMDSFFLPGSP